MLKGLGDIASLMKQAKEMQGRMGEIQDRLALMRIRGSAGGGMVAFEVNGKQDVIGCTVDPTLFESGDREMLEELVVSAMNDALHKSRQAGAEAMQEVAGGLNIPGLEGMMSKLGLGSGGSS
ncbi:MAG: YbaB/EbfC family nucleoid-associated protein [Planctomycetota bacterium]|nr:YbaB/EbfC family nucleoid-associated protein [Planctomycetota bacterium]MDA1164790.1 YbaB/EbfC family nucleoid-associated protein [Planctomycetota bacterium]